MYGGLFVSPTCLGFLTRSLPRTREPALVRGGMRYELFRGMFISMGMPKPEANAGIALHRSPLSKNAGRHPILQLRLRNVTCYQILAGRNNGWLGGNAISDILRSGCLVSALGMHMDGAWP